MRARRGRCYDARAHLWELSHLKRVRECGRYSVKADGSVTVRITERDDGKRSAGFAGLSTCGSVWACPVCSRKIAAQRQADVEHACRWWEDRCGGALALGSFTVAHHAGTSLRSLWDAVAAGWAAVTSGRRWLSLCKLFGIEGWIKHVEVTKGVNGWHPHAHVVFFLHHGLGQVERAKLSERLHREWNRGLAKHGFTSSAAYGVDVRMSHGINAARVLSEYLTKGVYEADGSAPRQVAFEVTGGMQKDNGGGRTPFQVLEDFLRSGDVEDLADWHEWERGSYKRRQSAWSKGLRELVRLKAELTDEEAAAVELGTAADDVVVLPRETVRQVRYVLPDLLDVAERDGADALRAWLDARDLAWLQPADRLRR
jgi:ribosomal protein L37AE/L43A